MPKSVQRWTTKPIELDEGAGVEEQVDALARRELAGLVLLRDALGAAPIEGAAVQVTRAWARRNRRDPR
jgi:hypothetical protein